MISRDNKNSVYKSWLINWNKFFRDVLTVNLGL